jgi:hypothetical protein
MNFNELYIGNVVFSNEDSSSVDEFKESLHHFRSNSTDEELLLLLIAQSPGEEGVKVFRVAGYHDGVDWKLHIVLGHDDGVAELSRLVKLVELLIHPGQILSLVEVTAVALARV